MLIAHLADTHLGHRHLHHVDSEGRNVREQDIFDAFRSVIEAFIDLRPAAVVHAGDFFDSYHPSTGALNVALDGLSALREAEIPLVAIAGNHSTPRQRNTEHVFALLDRFGSHHFIWAEPQTIRIGELAVHGVPHSHDAAVLAEQLRGAKTDPEAKYNVLVLHGGFEALSQVGTGEPGSVTLDPELLQEASEFDYIALGHLHIAQPVRLNAFYSGSLERLTFADTAPSKGFAVVDLARSPFEDERLRLEQVPARSFFEIPSIDCQGVDDPLPLIERALEGHQLDQAIVRCRLIGIDQGLWRTLDRRRLDELTGSCLHFELLPSFHSSGEIAVGAPAELSTFVQAHTPKGLKAEELLARANDYLARAGSEVSAE
jgi:exonuclease SbcD